MWKGYLATSCWMRRITVGEGAQLVSPSVPPTSPQPKSPSPSADLTWLLALQQAEHQAGEPRAVRVWAQGGEPHLPIKAWLVGRHDRGWPAQVSRLVHELDLLHRRPSGFTRAAEPGFPPPQPHSRGPPTRRAPQVHSLSSGAHRSCCLLYTSDAADDRYVV